MDNNKKCPYCGQEMTLGYIQCRDGVYWTLKKHIVAPCFLFGKHKTSLANGAAESSRTVYACKCSFCKKVIIDYSNETE